MKPMTKKMALENALTVVKAALSNAENSTEVVALTATVETIEAMIAQLSKPHTASPEAKAKMNAKRKEATAVARAELVANVAPILRKYLTEELTAKELFAKAQSELPEDFSAAKVQNILLREMAPELVKTEAKGKANTYRLA